MAVLCTAINQVVVVNYECDFAICKSILGLRDKLSLMPSMIFQQSRISGFPSSSRQAKTQWRLILETFPKDGFDVCVLGFPVAIRQRGGSRIQHAHQRLFRISSMRRTGVRFEFRIVGMSI